MKKIPAFIKLSSIFWGQITKKYLLFFSFLDICGFGYLNKGGEENEMG
jgi:hypothetical protein